MLTPHEIDGFERQLEEIVHATETTLKHLTKDLDFGDDIDDLDEETDESEEFANQLGIKQSLEERLANVKKALQRIKDKAYGRCLNCGRSIEPEVLHALPESDLCRKCKQKIAAK